MILRIRSNFILWCISISVTVLRISYYYIILLHWKAEDDNLCWNASLNKTSNGIRNLHIGIVVLIKESWRISYVHYFSKYHRQQRSVIRQLKEPKRFKEKAPCFKWGPFYGWNFFIRSNFLRPYRMTEISLIF